nr:probable carbohydrate esterase At4g34215 [Ipomoea batatas]
MNSAIIFLLFFLAFTVVNAGTVQKSIFILAGQSNMAGRGGVKGAPTPKNKNAQVWDNFIPPECRSHPSILRLNANLNWELATEPLHKDIDTAKTCGVGPGMCFAREVLKQESASLGVIGLVPCAIGGTSITQWSRGAPLYNKTLERAAAALRDGGKIQALLWYQGELEAQLGVGSFAKEVPRSLRIRNLRARRRQSLLSSVVSCIEMVDGGDRWSQASGTTYSCCRARTLTQGSQPCGGEKDADSLAGFKE